MSKLRSATSLFSRTFSLSNSLSLLYTHAAILLPPYIISVIRHSYPPHSLPYGVPLLHQHVHLPQLPYDLLPRRSPSSASVPLSIRQVALDHLRAALQTGFSGINSTDGLRAVSGLVYEYEQLQPVLDRQRETGPLSIAHILALAEETYTLGLSALTDALELSRITHSPDTNRIEEEIGVIGGEIEYLRSDETQASRLKIRQETLTSHKERLEMIKQQQLRVDELLHQSNRCEASLHRTRVELAALKIDRSEASVSTVTETLRKTINQAREVQKELQSLTF